MTFARPALIVAFALAALLTPRPAEAHWLLNFSTGQTVDPGALAFIGGTGGQLTRVGKDPQTAFTPFLAHAGIRVGLVDGLDVGYRLVTVPLPYSSVGPSLGAASDLKLRITPRDWAWHVALIGGGALSYLRLAGHDRFAWSPGGDVVASHAIGSRFEAAVNARYVYTAITSAPGGQAGNHVTAFGSSVGLRIGLRPGIAVMPEVGLFRFVGALQSTEVNGFGFQYGAVLSSTIQ